MCILCVHRVGVWWVWVCFVCILWMFLALFESRLCFCNKYIESSFESVLCVCILCWSFECVCIMIGCTMCRVSFMWIVIVYVCEYGVFGYWVSNYSLFERIVCNGVNVYIVCSYRVCDSDIRWESYVRSYRVVYIWVYFIVLYMVVYVNFWIVWLKRL